MLVKIAEMKGFWIKNALVFWNMLLRNWYPLFSLEQHQLTAMHSWFSSYSIKFFHSLNLSVFSDRNPLTTKLITLEQLVAGDIFSKWKNFGSSVSLLI